MNFESAVPVSAELVITKGTDKVDGKLTWNEERTVATFESTGNFAYGEYTITVTNGTLMAGVWGISLQIPIKPAFVMCYNVFIYWELSQVSRQRVLQSLL